VAQKRPNFICIVTGKQEEHQQSKYCVLAINKKRIVFYLWIMDSKEQYVVNLIKERILS